MQFNKSSNKPADAQFTIARNRTPCIQACVNISIFPCQCLTKD